MELIRFYFVVQRCLSDQHTVATPRWLSHADARTRLNNNSGISCWWQASRPTRTALNNVRLDVLFKTDEPVSMQVSAQLSIASARHEFGHVFLDTGDSVLEQLPDTFNYIIWQSTQPQHQGGGLTLFLAGQSRPHHRYYAHWPAARSVKAMVGASSPASAIHSRLYLGLWR